MFLGDGVRSILHEPVDAQPVRQPTSYANDLGLTVMMLAFRAGYIGSTPVGYRPESSSSVPFKVGKAPAIAFPGYLSLKLASKANLPFVGFIHNLHPSSISIQRLRRTCWRSTGSTPGR